MSHRTDIDQEFGPRTGYAFIEAKTLLMHGAGKDSITQQVLRMTALEVLDRGMQEDWDAKMRQRMQVRNGADSILNTPAREQIRTGFDEVEGW